MCQVQAVVCDEGEGVGMGVEKGFPSTGHGHPGSKDSGQGSFP